MKATAYSFLCPAFRQGKELREAALLSVVPPVVTHLLLFLCLVLVAGSLHGGTAGPGGQSPTKTGLTRQTLGKNQAWKVDRLQGGRAAAARSLRITLMLCVWPGGTARAVQLQSLKQA